MNEIVTLYFAIRREMGSPPAIAWTIAMDMLRSEA